MPGAITYVSVVALAALSAYIYPPVRHELTVVGIGRAVPTTTIPFSADYVKIEDTYHCEDLHHYAPANLLFAACEDRPTRFAWFPPLHNFEPPAEGTQGSFHVVDPETKKSIRLSFENFDKTFVTHGIDVIPDPKDKKAVYIFAVNHQPNPVFASSRREHIQKSNSRVEIFRYKIGSPTIRHVRTVADARIETPNDIFAVSPTEFWVTNDHAYREGLMRELETVAPVAWSTTMHVKITDLSSSSSFSSSSAPEKGLEVNIALTGVKSNNGLGHVHGSDEVTVISAERGILYRAYPEPNGTLTVRETIHLDSTLDNPSYYVDSWATASSNASGYVLAGLARGIDLASNAKKPEAMDPPYVWLVQKARDGKQTDEGEWEKKLVFADDGRKVRTASAAVIVGIDPKKEGGKKKGWLFVTGFMSENMVAVKIDL